MSKKKRKIYIINGFCHTSKVGYVSAVVSSRKKADEYKSYMDKIMVDFGDTVYWIDEREVV